MSWSEVRPWHAKYFGEIGASNPKFQNPLHVLVWGQTVACNHVFRNPPPRFMDFGFFRNLGHADITGQLISACHGLTSDRDMQISFGPAQAECYKPRPFRYRISFHFIVVSWVQVLNFKGPVISACPKFRKKSEIHKSWRWISEHMVACHGLTSDQDMQGVLEFWVNCPNFSEVFCMPRSDLRPGHARGLGILDCLPQNSQKYFACHGLTSDQDMQGVLEFWSRLPPQIPKSTLHATVWPQTRTCKGSWKFCWAGCLYFGEYLPTKHTMENW